MPDQLHPPHHPPKPRPFGSSLPVCLALFIVSVGVLMYAANIWNPNLFSNPIPGAEKDDVYYDNLAFNIAEGDGFYLDFTDQEWMNVYFQHSPGPDDWILDMDFEGYTTTRAPGFPYYLAGLYKAFGRRWDIVFALNWVILSLGLALLISTACRHYGIIVGVMALVTLSADFGVLKTVGQVMTEAIATSLTCVTFCCLIWAWHRTCDAVNGAGDNPDESARQFRKGIWRWAILGMFFGGTLLFRSNLVAWLMMFVALSIPWSLLLLTLRKKPGRYLSASLIFVVTVCMVCLPWWNRNCQVTEKFEPFGSAGSIGWVGGYSDATIANHGNWDLPTVLENQRDAMEVYDISGAGLAQQEYYMGELSRKKASEWAKKNVSQLPLLMVNKGLNHLGLIGQDIAFVPWLNALLLFGAVIGCLFSWHRFGFWIALVVFFSLATTMLTWSHHGRYLIPIRPLIHCACAIGTVYFWSFVITSISHRRKTAVAS